MGCDHFFGLKFLDLRSAKHRLVVVVDQRAEGGFTSRLVPGWSDTEFETLSQIFDERNQNSE